MYFMSISRICILKHRNICSTTFSYNNYCIQFSGYQNYPVQGQSQYPQYPPQYPPQNQQQPPW